MITSIKVQKHRDGRPEGICWCGYPIAVCQHPPKAFRIRPLQKSKFTATIAEDLVM